MENIETPDHDWQYAFDRLNTEERFMLVTLFSLPSPVSVNTLREAYAKRYFYEIENTTVIYNADAFTISIERLKDTFIYVFYPGNNDEAVVHFMHHSIGDFISSYLNESQEERKRLLFSIRYIEQLTCYTYGHIELSSSELLGFSKFYIENCAQIDTYKANQNYLNIQRVEFILFYLEEQFHSDALNYFKQIAFSSLHRSYFYYVIQIFEQAHSTEIMRNCIQTHFDYLLKSLIKMVEEFSELEEIRPLFLLYNISYDDFMLRPENVTLLKEVFNTCMSKIEEEEISALQKTIVSVDEAYDLELELLLKKTSYEEKYFAKKIMIYKFREFDDYHWDMHIVDNYFFKEMGEDFHDAYSDPMENNIKEEMNDISRNDDLPF